MRINVKVYILAAAVLALAIGFALPSRYFSPVFSDNSAPGYHEDPDSVYCEADGEPLRLFFSQRQGCSLLFLPPYISDDDSLYLRGPAGSLLDGAPLPLGEKTSALMSGTHTLFSPVLGDHPLIVCRASALPSIFLTLGDAELKGLYSPPYDKQPFGELIIRDGQGHIIERTGLEGIRVRGNTSADWPKKPYQLNLSQPRPLLGMESAVRWNLMSNWSDKSLLRNQVAMDMSRSADLGYTPDAAFCNLYINGEFQGLYQLSEKVEVAVGRVDIRDLMLDSMVDFNEEDRAFLARQLEIEDQLRFGEDIDDEGRRALDEELTALLDEYRVERLDDGRIIRGWDTVDRSEDLTGGYLLELERPSRIRNSSSYFVTRAGQPVTVKYPEYVSRDQVSYLAGLWQGLEDGLRSEDGKDPASGRHYSEIIDVDSLIRKYLLEEVTRNYDASSTSQYFYKDSDSINPLIAAGPAWDYDMSMGNSIMSPLTNQHYISSVSPYGMYASLYMDDYTLYAMVYDRPELRDRAAKLYGELYKPALEGLVSSGLQDLSASIRDSAVMDELRWEKYDGDDSLQRLLSGTVYDEAVAELRNFLDKRQGYLTGLWLEGRENFRAYLSVGNADSYVSYVENLKGEPLEEPPAPLMEGCDFLGWANGYTGEAFDFSQPWEGEALYLAAIYRRQADGEVFTEFIE